jgi:hypothetical protein
MENNRESQEKMILAYLHTGKRLTPLHALELFGCFRLSARIYDITARGIEIQSELVTLENGKRVKSYWV